MWLGLLRSTPITIWQEHLFLAHDILRSKASDADTALRKLRDAHVMGSRLEAQKKKLEEAEELVVRSQMDLVNELLQK